MIYESTILDCYTDEPAGLGVPPYLGVHPRYVAGSLNGKVNYITIDDLRNFSKEYIKKRGLKTDIKTYNLTRKSIKEVLEKTKNLYVVAGIQTPGKYLSAYPGTLKEVSSLINGLKCRRILCGPAVSGTQLEGGKKQERLRGSIFDDVFEDYSELNDIAIKGAVISKQIPWLKMIEIESGKGCVMGNCSFCTEPLKAGAEWREQKEIHKEMKKFYDLGERYFRIGKQSCFFSYKGGNVEEIEKLLRPIGRESNLNLKVLHIDNVNPCFVNEERTKAVVKHCTEGNVAAFGVESFDAEVVRRNNMNTPPETAMNAIRIINKIGGKRGPNGMHYLLPGINIIFGLIGESRKTGEINFEYLKKILDGGLLLRRINIRQVTPFEGTKMWEVGTRFIKKNKRFYWRWRNNIRKKIDYEMLKRLVPAGTLLKDVKMEIYDGNNTFGRQMGTYPLVVGVKKRLELGKFYNVRIISHMLRSVVGEVV